MQFRFLRLFAVFAASSLLACVPGAFDRLSGKRPDAGPDASASDAGSTVDAATQDAGVKDAAVKDAGSEQDAGPLDLSLTHDSDDAIWCIREGKLDELLHYTPQDGADGYTLEVGSDSEQCRTGLRFVLPLLPGSRVLSAKLSLYHVGPADNAPPTATMRVQVFESTMAPPFADADMHDTPAQHAPGGLWPTWVGGFAVGNTESLIESPDLKQLLQHELDKSTWKSGSTVMLFLAPDAMTDNQYVQLRDSYAGEYPPRLVVHYAPP